MTAPPTTPRRTGAFVDLLRPCPLDGCNHSLAMHDRTDQTETGWRCRANPCPEQCGEHVVDLADEEWN